MSGNSAGGNELVGTKSFVGAAVFLLVGVPLLGVGLLVVLLLYEADKPVSALLCVVGVFTLALIFGGAWCMHRSWAYATGKAKPLLPNEDSDGAVVISVMVIAPVLHLISKVETWHLKFFVAHAWILPASTFLVATAPFIVWYRKYRWKHRAE